MLINPQKTARTLLRKIFAAQAVAVIICLSAFLVTAFTIWNSDYKLLALFLYVLFLLAGRLVLGLVVLAILRKLEAIINDQCDPQSYLAVYDLIKEERALRGSKITISLNRANAQYWCGDFAPCRDTLQNIKFPSAMPLLRAYYHFLLGKTSLKLGDVAAADEALGQLQHLNNTAKAGSRLARNLEPCLRILRLLIDQHKNATVSTVTACQQELQQANCNLEKVTTTYRLAEAHIAADDSQQAREALLFVVQTGGNLFCVAQAQTLLNQIENEAGK